MRTFTSRCAVPLLALLLVTGIAQGQESFTGKVVSVTDGDTIQVMHNGRAEKIRLWGIDTPEKAQAFGTKAKQFTSEQAFGKVVTVEVKDTDRYGRTVGVVTLPNGRILNRELVSNGLAWWYEQYAPNDRALKRLHNYAVEKKLGLWSDPEPCRAMGEYFGLDELRLFFLRARYAMPARPRPMSVMLAGSGTGSKGSAVSARSIVKAKSVKSSSEEPALVKSSKVNNVTSFPTKDNI